MSRHALQANCEKCFGLCCVALPYAKSADFAFDKDSGTPCRNLQDDYRCSIHNDLRKEGFRGCTVYECFGAGQKVSQLTYKGIDWKDNATSKEMFEVFPIMQQLHEILYYLDEAANRIETSSIHKDLLAAYEVIEKLTKLNPQEILKLDVHLHRGKINELLLRTSELVRASVPSQNKKSGKRRSTDFLGAKLKGANLRGSNFRGALLIAADLRDSDLRTSDFIGADMRDANVSGANLIGSIFLTQAQINAANGDIHTKLPSHLRIPDHWENKREQVFVFNSGLWYILYIKTWNGECIVTEVIISCFKDYSVWLDSLSEINESTWTTPIKENKWSISEIIAHITKWDNHLIAEVLPSVRKEQGIEFPEFDSFNKAASVYAKSGFSQSQILLEAKQTRERLVNELTEMSLEQLTKHVPVNGVSHCPHTGTPYSMIYIIEEFIYHDNHHKEQIIKFLEECSLV